MITVSTTIKNKTLAEVWKYFTNPVHVIHWNNASDEWHCPKAENNLEVGKYFTYTMAAKNGEMSFDFTGIYTEIELFSKINYVLTDDRKILITFKETENGIEIVEKFDPETENSEEMQQTGWQNILDNFKNILKIHNYANITIYSRN